MSFEYQVERIVEWAQDRGILDDPNEVAQFMKTLEEISELGAAINNQDKDDIADAIGDVLVTIIIQAHIQNIDINEALENVIDIITARKGRMINGMFVKEES